MPLCKNDFELESFRSVTGNLVEEAILNGVVSCDGSFRFCGHDDLKKIERWCIDKDCSRNSTTRQSQL